MRLGDAVSLWDVHYILKTAAGAGCLARQFDKLKKWPERA